MTNQPAGRGGIIGVREERNDGGTEGGFVEQVDVERSGFGVAGAFQQGERGLALGDGKARISQSGTHAREDGFIAEEDGEFLDRPAGGVVTPSETLRDLGPGRWHRKRRFVLETEGKESEVAIAAYSWD